MHLYVYTSMHAHTHTQLPALSTSNAHTCTHVFRAQTCACTPSPPTCRHKATHCCFVHHESAEACPGAVEMCSALRTESLV